MTNVFVERIKLFNVEEISRYLYCKKLDIFFFFLIHKFNAKYEHVKSTRNRRKTQRFY